MAQGKNFALRGNVRIVRLVCLKIKLLNLWLSGSFSKFSSCLFAPPEYRKKGKRLRNLYYVEGLAEFSLPGRIWQWRQPEKQCEDLRLRPMPSDLLTIIRRVVEAFIMRASAESVQLLKLSPCSRSLVCNCFSLMCLSVHLSALYPLHCCLLYDQKCILFKPRIDSAYHGFVSVIWGYTFSAIGCKLPAPAPPSDVAPKLSSFYLSCNQLFHSKVQY